MEQRKIRNHLKNISWNQLFSNSFSKAQIVKKVWEIISVISLCKCENRNYHSHLNNIPWNDCVFWCTNEKISFTKLLLEISWYFDENSVWSWHKLISLNIHTKFPSKWNDFTKNSKIKIWRHNLMEKYLFVGIIISLHIFAFCVYRVCVPLYLLKKWENLYTCT